jgi:uncharacterized membrane protein YfcA
MVNIMNDIGWVVIYVFAFGISDLIVKKYIKTDTIYVLYYLFLGLIGYYLVFSNSQKCKSTKDIKNNDKVNKSFITTHN